VQRVSRILAALTLAGTLLVGRSPSAQAQHLRAPTGWTIAQTARAYVGYPYAYVGDTPYTGFSCVGFVHYIFGLSGVYAPENLWALWNGYHIAPQYIHPGDVLLFVNTVWAGLSHAAIYVGNGYMIGADNFSVGVHLDRLADSYWYSRWLGTVRYVW
jgi:cell wall-associated NlpC family hydrolase